MNAASFFNQIRAYINNNATHANDVARSDARTCGANNISVFVGPFKFAGKYELAIEGRNAGRGYVTVRHLTATEHRLIADECTLHPVFDADECNGAVLAILEAQDAQRGEDAIALGDDVALLADVTDERRADQSPIEKARQMIAEGTASERIKTEVASADRMTRIIQRDEAAGLEPGRNVRDALMANEANIKWEVAK